MKLVILVLSISFLSACNGTMKKVEKIETQAAVSDECKTVPKLAWQVYSRGLDATELSLKRRFCHTMA